MASVTTKWICQSCSCHNHPSSTRCAVCNSSRPTDLYYPLPRQSPRLTKLGTTTGGLSHPISLGAGEAGISSDMIIDHSLARYRPSSIPLTSQGRDGRGEWGWTGGGGSSSAHQSKWVCSVCTYGNWPNSKHCTMCNTLRRHHKLSPQIGGDGLPGGSGSNGGGLGGGGGGGSGAGGIGDSILNYVPRHLDYASPGAVGGGMYDEIRVPSHSQYTRDSTSNRSAVKAKKKSSVDNRSGQRKWKCSKCTYENWVRAGKCVMCQAPKNKTPSPPMSDSETSHSSPNQAPKHRHLSSPSENANSTSSSSPLASLSSSSLHSRSQGLNSNQSPSSASPAHPDTSPSAVHLIPCTTADTSSEVLPSSSLKSTSNEVRQIRNRLSSSDWLFINACLGVVNEDVPAVKAYLRGEGDRARQLGRDECLVLGQPSIFSVGSTLVHLAIR